MVHYLLVEEDSVSRFPHPHDALPAFKRGPPLQRHRHHGLHALRLRRMEQRLHQLRRVPRRTLGNTQVEVSNLVNTLQIESRVQSGPLVRATDVRSKWM